MHIICFNSRINSFEVAFIYYLNYAIGTKEVDGSKYNYSCQMYRLRVGCAQVTYQKNTI